MASEFRCVFFGRERAGGAAGIAAPDVTPNAADQVSARSAGTGSASGVVSLNERLADPAGTMDPGERAIDQQPEFVVAARPRQRQRVRTRR
jgi:hypothetical protein